MLDSMEIDHELARLLCRLGTLSQETMMPILVRRLVYSGSSMKCQSMDFNSQVDDLKGFGYSLNAARGTTYCASLTTTMQEDNRILLSHLRRGQLLHVHLILKQRTRRCGNISSSNIEVFSYMLSLFRCSCSRIG